MAMPSLRGIPWYDMSRSVVLAALALASVSGSAMAEGLPQLDVATFEPQIIWLAVSFVSLYLLMARVALPRISQVIDERQHKIDESLKKAEAIKIEAEAALEAYEKSLSEARDKAHDILRESHEQIANEAAKRHENLSRRLNEEIAEAEAAIAKAREKALGSIRGITMDVTRTAIRCLAGIELSEKDAAPTVDAAIREHGL